MDINVQVPKFNCRKNAREYKKLMRISVELYVRHAWRYREQISEPYEAATSLSSEDSTLNHPEIKKEKEIDHVTTLK